MESPKATTLNRDTPLQKISQAFTGSLSLNNKRHPRRQESPSRLLHTRHFRFHVFSSTLGTPLTILCSFPQTSSSRGCCHSLVLFTPPQWAIKADLPQTLSFCGTNGIAFVDSALRQPFVLTRVSNAQYLFPLEHNEKILDLRHRDSQGHPGQLGLDAFLKSRTFQQMPASCGLPIQGIVPFSLLLKAQVHAHLPCAQVRLLGGGGTERDRCIRPISGSACTVTLQRRLGHR